MRTVLVTGGAGFIGANFAHYLMQTYPDYTVVVYDKLTYAGNLANLQPDEHDPRLHFVQGDIVDIQTVRQAMREHKVDAIVNVAAETHVELSIIDPDAIVRTNVNGTYTLLEAARELDVERFLQISTGE